jgi:porphobilinogen deaminase
LNKYPTHKVVDLRGNVNLRMKSWTKVTGTELFCSCWFRKNQLKPGEFTLDWMMIPAPAQGCLLLLCKKMRLHWCFIAAKRYWNRNRNLYRTSVS